MTNYHKLSVEIHDHIAVVRLDRPDQHNALDRQLLLELEHAVHSFREDAEVRVVVFTGAGKHFCSGADVDYLIGMQSQPMIERRRSVRLGERIFHAMREMEQITLCAWNGAAIGAGACLATATDLRIGAQGCFVQYPEIDIGMNLMWQCLPRTTRLVGEARAIRLAIGGERADAATLLDWGLLDEVVPPESLLERTLTVAKRYAQKPPVAAQMIKRSISATGGQLDRAMMHADSDQHVLATMTKDHERALTAYRERTVGRFLGD